MNTSKNSLIFEKILSNIKEREYEDNSKDDVIGKEQIKNDIRRHIIDEIREEIKSDITIQLNNYYEEERKKKITTNEILIFVSVMIYFLYVPELISFINQQLIFNNANAAQMSIVQLNEVNNGKVLQLITGSIKFISYFFITVWIMYCTYVLFKHKDLKNKIRNVFKNISSNEGNL